LEKIVDAIFWSVLAGWLLLAAFLIWRLRVLSPKVLSASPTRHSSLSLPIIGAVILLYLFAQTALALAGYAGGWLTKEDLGITETQPATMEAATASAPTLATTAASSSAPAADAGGGEAKAGGITRDTKLNLVGLLTYVLTLTPILIVVPWLFAERRRGWGISLRQLPQGVAKGALGWVVVFPLVFAVGILLEMVYQSVGHEVTEHSTFVALDHNPARWEQIFLKVMAIGVAPIVEEILFRGVLQTTLIQYGWGALIPQFMHPTAIPKDYRPPASQRWAAIAITSVLFALLHPLDHFPIIFALSVGLGYVYERTGNLWAPIILHAGFNGAQVGLYEVERIIKSISGPPAP
jgi:membrane protease YdiL (CAAX protease family)